MSFIGSSVGAGSAVVVVVNSGFSYHGVEVVGSGVVDVVGPGVGGVVVGSGVVVVVGAGVVVVVGSGVGAAVGTGVNGESFTKPGKLCHAAQLGVIAAHLPSTPELPSKHLYVSDPSQPLGHFTVVDPPLDNFGTSTVAESV